MPDETQQAPKRKKKRFKDRESVIKAIDEVERLNHNDRIDAEVNDAIADMIRDKFKDDRYIRWQLQINSYREHAKRMRSRAFRRTEKELPKLKRALATIQTPVLSIKLTGGDESIPRQ